MQWWARYVGLPFGEGPGEVHCWGLVRRVYADRLGVDLPEYGDVSARDLMRVAREMSVGALAWRDVEVPREMDVVLMRRPTGGRYPVHVGVMVDARRMLHVEEASAAVAVPVSHASVSGRILGFRRYSQITDRL